jgi:hypothetical protein
MKLGKNVPNDVFLYVSGLIKGPSREVLLC